MANGWVGLIFPRSRLLVEGVCGVLYARAEVNLGLACRLQQSEYVAHALRSLCKPYFLFPALSLRVQGTQLLPANLTHGHTSVVSAGLEDQNLLTAFHIIPPSERPDESGSRCCTNR